MPAQASDSFVMPRMASFSPVPAVLSLCKAAGARHHGHSGAEGSYLLGRVALLHGMRTSAISFTCCHGVRGPCAPASSKCSHLLVEELG